MPDEISSEPFDPSSVTRPDRALMTYYTLIAACTIVGFPFVIVPLYFKYHTLTYRFDDKGVSMSWGILFRREIYLTYRRIQDIHVTRNIFHRWLGLAEVAVQTASGSSGAEMSIEGIRQPERIRDFLYSRMRGARGEGEAESEETPEDETLTLLREIRDAAQRLAKAAGGPT
jgi:putative membrane protein